MPHEQAQSAGDDDLVAATLRGDAASFGTLVERYWPMAFALALMRMKDPSEADDVAQESFLKAYSHLHSLRDRRRFAGWLGRIVRQQSTNARRRNSRHRAVWARNGGELSDLEGMPAYAPNPGLSDVQIQFVRGVVGRLPEKFRNVIIMRFVTGLSAVQIAERLGKRPGTVRVWLHRAYAILRKDLAPLLEEVEL